MVKISILHRHGTYEEFEGEDVDMSPSESILMIYDGEGRISHMIPFDSVASIDFDYEEEEEEEEDEDEKEISLLEAETYRVAGFAPNYYWDKEDK